MRQKRKETPEQFEQRRRKTEANNAREASIFQMACIRLGLTPTTGAEAFSVSKPTYWAWMNGKHRIPHSAFVRLAELDNQKMPEQFERVQAMKEFADRLGIKLFSKQTKKTNKKQPQKPTSEE